MTVPDPHIAVLSRRALRARVGERSTDAAARAAATLTRRSLRSSSTRVGHESHPVVFASWRTGDAPDDAVTPIWTAVATRPVAPPPLDDPHQQAAAVARPAAAIKTATPPIFRPPPPPEPVVLQPLLHDRDGASAPVRHGRRRGAPLRLALAGAMGAAVIVGGSAAMTAAAVTGTPMPLVAAAFAAVSDPAPSPSPLVTQTAPPPPVVAMSLETAAPTPTPEPTPADPCALPAVAAALPSRDDAAVIAASGGAMAFRAAVASGGAPCIDLGDPSLVWVVVDKTRPLDPLDFAPAQLSSPDGVRTLENGVLEADASAALSTMVSAAAQAGAGEIAVQSAYRSHATQVRSYGTQVAGRGTDAADLVSARPGYSEHQTGLAADVVACDGGCSTFDDLAVSAQGQWIAAHSWEYGWIVRYEDGETPVTGYSPEPWHLRYIGVDLATAYHDGGWHTLEEFFGLPASPDYAD